MERTNSSTTDWTHYDDNFEPVIRRYFDVNTSLDIVDIVHLFQTNSLFNPSKSKRDSKDHFEGTA
jgi:hypothetical protein